MTILTQFPPQETNSNLYVQTLQQKYLKENIQEINSTTVN